VNPHLEAIPGLRTLTTRSLTGGDLEDLGWEADGSLNTEVLSTRSLAPYPPSLNPKLTLGSGTLNQVGGDLLQGLDLPGGESDTDLVDLGAIAQISLFWFVVRHRRYLLLWSGDTFGCSLELLAAGSYDMVDTPRVQPGYALLKCVKCKIIYFFYTYMQLLSLGPRPSSLAKPHSNYFIISNPRWKTSTKRSVSSTPTLTLMRAVSTPYDAA